MISFTLYKKSYFVRGQNVFDLELEYKVEGITYYHFHQKTKYVMFAQFKAYYIMLWNTSLLLGGDWEAAGSALGGSWEAVGRLLGGR